MTDKNSDLAWVLASALLRATSNSLVRAWMRRSKSSFKSFSAWFNVQSSRLLDSVIRSASFRARRSRSKAFL